MDDPDNYYRHLVTGRCTLPEDFFAGHEELQYAELHPCLDYSWVSSLLYYQITFRLSDETMLGRNPLVLTAESDAHMIDMAVGRIIFDIGYDGQDFVITEPDEIIMEPFGQFT